MSNGVEFDVDNMQYGTRRPSSGSQGSFSGNLPSGNEPKMVQWLMKKGIVKSPNTAQVFLIAVVILNIIITVIVIKFLL